MKRLTIIVLSLMAFTSCKDSDLSAERLARALNYNISNFSIPSNLDGKTSLGVILVYEDGSFEECGSIGISRGGENYTCLYREVSANNFEVTIVSEKIKATFDFSRPLSESAAHLGKLKLGDDIASFDQINKEGEAQRVYLRMKLN